MKPKKIIALFLATLILSAFQAPNPKLSASLRFVNYDVFVGGEKLEYVVHYGIINAGRATLEIKKEPYHHNGRNCTKIEGIGRSIGAFDFFFKVRDSYVTYMNTETLEPIKFVRHVDEGGFVFDQEYNFFHQENKVTTQKGDTVTIPANVQDLVSGYYFARNIDLHSYNNGDIIHFKAFVDGKVEPVRVRMIGKETISIRSGKYRCFKFMPIVQKGRVFNDEEDVIFYVSDDKNKIPVLVEAKVLVGSVKLELTRAKGLAHPLAKL